jgi:hypothetical protein
MTDSRSKSLLRALIYPVQFDANPVSAIDRVFRQVVERAALNGSVEEYRQAVDAGLGSTASVAELIPQSHSESEIRAYLLAMHDRLYGLRVEHGGERKTAVLLEEDLTA